MLYCIYPVKLTDVLNLNVLVYEMFQLIPSISYVNVEMFVRCLCLSSTANGEFYLAISNATVKLLLQLNI